jgi:hypothetical protein
MHPFRDAIARIAAANSRILSIVFMIRAPRYR